jgi:hypothetical protein
MLTPFELANGPQLDLCQVFGAKGFEVPANRLGPFAYVHPITP